MSEKKPVGKKNKGRDVIEREFQYRYKNHLFLLLLCFKNHPFPLLSLF